MARNTRKTAAVALCASFALGLAAAGPAAALDDDGHQGLFQTFTGILNSGLGLTGLTTGPERPPIEYRDRAPLVVPPSKELQAPLPPIEQRNAAWPRDFDAERVRRNQTEARRLTERDELGNEIVSARQLRDTGRLARNPGRDPVAEECGVNDPLAQACNVPQMWNILRNARRTDGPQDMTPGVEPPRQALTDPPPGFRIPSQRAEYTFEPATDRGAIPDPREAIREEARRDRQYQ